jgi:hypothetical protein
VKDEVFFELVKLNDVNLSKEDENCLRRECKRNGGKVNYADGIKKLM